LCGSNVGQANEEAMDVFENNYDVVPCWVGVMAHGSPVGHPYPQTGHV
jgi:hypothetical protein